VRGQEAAVGPLTAVAALQCKMLKTGNSVIGETRIVSPPPRIIFSGYKVAHLIVFTLSYDLIWSLWPNSLFFPRGVSQI
jgi:hypothetical protein